MTSPIPAAEWLRNGGVQVSQEGTKEATSKDNPCLPTNNSTHTNKQAQQPGCSAGVELKAMRLRNPFMGQVEACGTSLDLAPSTSHLRGLRLAQAYHRGQVETAY